MVIGDDLRRAIVQEFRHMGFLHVALDLEGYVSGSMNRGIEMDLSVPAEDEGDPFDMGEIGIMWEDIDGE
jgi:hypothetical protein